jgi:hypothetical protein
MDTTIVIQGPTNYYKEVLKNLSSNQQYVWSTWDNEPDENLNQISKEIPLIITSKPNNVGTSNINLQCTSSFNGIKQSNTQFIFKTRSDMVFDNIDKLLEIISKNNKTLSFIHYGMYMNYRQVCDWFSFGNLENSKIFWNYKSKDNHYPPPETRLTNNYIEKSKETFENFNFFNHLTKEFDIYWIKKNLQLSNFYKNGAGSDVRPKIYE